MRKARCFVVIVSGLGLLSAHSAFANIIWPAALLESRLLAWYVIVAGLVVEFLFLWRGLKLPSLNAVVVDVVMNGASGVVGWFLLPWLGFGYEFFPGRYLNAWLHMGTFNPLAWAVTCCLAFLLSTVVEAAVIRWLFRIPLSRRNMFWLSAANLISVVIAFVSLAVSPPEL
jgi:hypothetical protein